MSQVRGVLVELNALKSDGTIVVSEKAVGVTVGAATYFFLLGGASDCPLESVHVKWDGLCAGVFTIESSNMRRGENNNDVTDYSTSAGDWIKEDPSTAYVPTGGTGAVVANATVTLTAGGAGGAIWHVGNMGTRRLRLKALLSTGGVLRVAAHGKSM